MYSTMNLKYFPFLFLYLSCSAEPLSTEVTLEQGVLRGKVSGDGSYIEYTGVPYGTANQTNRFQAPYPAPSWDGIFSATDESIVCPQQKGNEIIGVEDCLRLNIYVPNKGQRSLPVMFYIHGGGYQEGDGGKVMLAPGYLIRQEVILVTINYRLGALGFTCLGIKEAPGNAGLKDQLAALRWVKKNIAAFGGDPENITIFGQSAGGSSVSFFLCNARADGLYNRVIAQSGVSTAFWAINKDPIYTTSLLAKSLGFNTTDPYQLHEIISKAYYKDLARSPGTNQAMMIEEHYYNLPCVEKHIPGVEPYLTDLPYNILKSKSLDVPVIYGSNNNEALLFILQNDDSSMRKKSDKLFLLDDIVIPSEDEKNIVKQKLKEYYLGDDEYFEMKNIMKLSKYMSHTYFNMPCLFEVELLARNSKKPIYYNTFGYSGDRNCMKISSGFRNESGAAHADDLFYLFNGTMWADPGTTKDQTMILWMTKMWTNFAKYNDPTPEFDVDLPVKWTPINTHGQCLYIEEELKMGPIPLRKEYDMWNEIYSKYRRTWA